MRGKKDLRALIIWVVIAGAVLLPVIALVAYRMYLAAAVEERLQAIRDAGYPATMEELAAWAPEVPEAENAASVYLKAFAAYRSAGDKVFSDLMKKVPLVSNTKLPPRGEPMAEEMQDSIGAYLGKYEEAMTLLHRAGSMKRSRYPVDYTGGFGMRLDHLSTCRHAARLLSLEAVLAAERGDGAGVVRSVKSSLGVARSLRTEPILISQLVRMACRSIVSRGLARVLSRIRLTDAQLRELEAGFTAELDKDMMARAFAGERCCGVGLFRDMREGRMRPGAVMKLPQAVNILMMIGLLDKDFKSYLDLMNGYVRALERPMPEQMAATRAVEKKVMGVSRFCFFTRMLVPALSRASIEGARSRARIEAARAALAVERYRLKYGRAPARLDDAAPEFIEAVPVDPFDGKPLRYERRGEGYVVYSVGENGKDDGGREYGGEKRRGPRLDEVFEVVSGE